MSTSPSRRGAAARLSLLLLLFLTACASAQPLGRTDAPTPDRDSAAPAASPVSRGVPIIAPAVAYAAEAPTATPPPTPAPPTPVPPTATPDPAASPTSVPTPSPRPAGTAPRVGLQVGHLRSDELPEELVRLRTSTGARWGGVSEAALNLDIVNRIRPILEAQGVVVDILPATVPPGYDADAFLAIHADGSTGAARGWKLATPWRASEASKQLLAAVAAAYGPATGLPEDVGGITFNMKGYYAFNFRRHTHAIARTTPAIIVEMGFMTSASDRAVLFNQPDRVARGIADGIMAYLRQRDPANGAALTPPDYPALRVGPAGATLRAAPRDDARVLVRVDAEARLMPFDKQNGYYQAFVRGGATRTVGWVREDQVVVTTEQPSFPTATNP